MVRSTLARFVLALVLVAIGAAAFAIVFRTLLSFVFVRGLDAPDVVSAFEALPAWARLLLPGAGGLMAGSLATMGRSAMRGQGVGQVMEAVVFGGRPLSLRGTLQKSLGSWFAIAGGGSIGREGPLIQFGATLGDAVARRLGVDEERGRALMTAGTAAGFAAAYNTPFAAVLFVLEVVAGVAVLDVVLACAFAAALATAITRAALGGGPIYGQRQFVLASPAELLAHALLGIVGALGAQAFMRLLSAGEAAFARSALPQPWRAGCGGLVVGVLALWVPQVTGNGYEPLNTMLDGHVSALVVASLLGAKVVATTASVSSGSPGGVFTPTLFVGAALGICFQALLARLVPSGMLGGAGAYALVGMAATTAATTHAPLMAAVLVFELSGDYAIALPLLIATALATAVSRALREDSIYGAELRRRGIAWQLTISGRRVTGSQHSPDHE